MRQDDIEKRVWQCRGVVSEQEITLAKARALKELSVFFARAFINSCLDGGLDPSSFKPKLRRYFFDPVEMVHYYDLQMVPG